MTTARRSINSPKAYQNQPEGRVNLYNQTYIGFVKEIADSTYMGRLKVWIPEIHPSAADGNDRKNWITVNYCSPFAGATPVSGNIKDGQEESTSQQSYGWWAVPPHVDNEVVVIFANGDPNRGMWIGCLYQQRMNHMVPGLASSASFQEGEEGNDPPTVEYNKKDESQASSSEPMRPRFNSLHDGLLAQGLYSDSQRGPSTTTARRNVSATTTDDGRTTSYAEASHAYGFVTPRGNTIHVDDNPENEFIRMRTRSGAQVLINETIGYIYMISKNGNSWFEISDEGINAFTTRSFNVRAMQGTNIHTEGNTVINSVGSTNMTGSTGSFQVTGDLDIVVPGSFRVSTAGGIHLNAMGDINLNANGSASIVSSGTLALQSNGNLGVTSSGQLFLNGSKIHQNGGSGPAATMAEEATAPEPNELFDREVSQSSGYAETSTKSTVSILPTHEPWEGHPLSETQPDTIAINGSVSSPVVYDGSTSEVGDAGRTFAEDTTPIPPNTDWIVPCSGRISSRYGPRRGGIHSGIDIAAPIGTPIYATAAGKVVKAGPASGYGLAIYIDHGNGWITEYGHVNSISVSKNSQIQQGQLIGTVGNRGRSTGPHLHLTFRRKGGGHRNPESFIKGLKARNVKAKTK